MGIKDLFQTRKSIISKHNINSNNVDNLPEIPDGLYDKCKNCGETILTEDLVNNSFVCPKCDHHVRIRAIDRINILVDKDSFNEFGAYLKTENPLNFPGYIEKIDKLTKKTNLNEAVITGTCKINGVRNVIVVMDSYFMMGSMGSIVGEKITRAIEKATKLKLPLIIFSASGGARMQEGIMSLMQMAKTSSALANHNDKGLLYLSVITHPTTGGVTASFATLGDIILAEPNALIGFAGPRVIEQTIRQKLPEGFQTSEFLLEKGFIDNVVHRKDLKNVIANILQIHKGV